MFRITSFTVALLFLLCLPASSQAQVEKWQRVFTGDEFSVDVNPASLWFEPHIFRAQFRTVFSKPETISGSSSTKYTTSLETIEFTTDGHYRRGETILLDSAGKIVQSSSPDSARDWKVVKGAVTARLFDAAHSLSPFGLWTVIGYRYADGKPDENTALRELVELNGTWVGLALKEVAVGKQRCSSPNYLSHSLTDNEFFLKQGILLESLGVHATQGAIILECGTREWTSSRSLLLPLPSGNLLMLWKGVFIELKKSR